MQKGWGQDACRFLICAQIITLYDKGRKGLALGRGTAACLHKTGIIWEVGRSLCRRSGGINPGHKNPEGRGEMFRSRNKKIVRNRSASLAPSRSPDRKDMVLFLSYYRMLCVQKGSINKVFFNNHLSTKCCKNKFSGKWCSHCGLPSDCFCQCATGTVGK